MKAASGGQTPTIPAGTVTFLFTDIEASTQAWDRRPEAMRAALAEHDSLMRACVEKNEGYIFKTAGDAFYCTFSEPLRALRCAIAAQQEFGTMQWRDIDPLRVRMALHTGAAELRHGDYFGPALNRVSRLLALVRGGQIVLSHATERLVGDELPEGVSLEDLGEHRLRDLQTNERPFQVHFPNMEPILGLLSAPDAPPNNLPGEISTFFARSSEVAALHSLFPKARLITIAGPGGVGKTRLCAHVAAQALRRFGDGVWFVELAPIDDAALIAQTVAKLLRVRPAASRDVREDIVAAIGNKTVLIVLDNCEHLLAQCAELVRYLLERCAQLTILATSREPLHVGGEQTVTLDPFAVPARTPGFEELARNETIRFLVERATAAKSDFRLTQENAPVLLEICRQLDGIPLAMELAAARFRTLSPQQIVERLDQRLNLLTGGDPTGPAHHRTLRSTIDWSYDLLDVRERELFARLAIFRSPFSLEAVESVCTDDAVPESEALDLLVQLVEKSFVTYVEEAGVPRYRLFHTLAAYATEKLREQERTTLDARHFSFLFDKAESARRTLSAEENRRWIEDMDRLHPDVCAALDWAFTHDCQSARELCLDLVQFWNTRGYLAEGQRYLETAASVECSEDAHSSARGRALANASALASAQGDQATAAAHAEAARQLFEGTGDRGGSADALRVLAGMYNNNGDYERAEGLYREALALYLETGDEAGRARTMANLGLVLISLNKYDDAHTVVGEALDLARKLQDERLRVWVLGLLGFLAHQQRDYPRASAYYLECVGLSREIGDKPALCTALNHLAEVALVHQDGTNVAHLLEESLEVGSDHGLWLQLADSLEGCARLAQQHADTEPLAQLTGCVDAMRERLHFPFAPSERAARDARINAARDADAGNRYDACYAAGCGMTVEQGVALARAYLRSAR